MKPRFFLAIAVMAISISSAHAARRCATPSDYKPLGEPFIGIPQAAPMKPAAAGPEVMTIEGDALFAFGKSDLSAAGRVAINRLLNNVSNNYTSIEKIEVTGHSDPIGSPVQNQKLSEDRAATVGKLMSADLPDVKITTTGAGSSQPAVNCGKTPTPQNITCNKANRRVEIKVYGETR